MIKETKKNREKKKPFLQVLLEYLRTIFIAIAIGVFVTILLSLHARSEMIKNLHAEKMSGKIDEKLAKKLIQQTDFINSLASKNYLVCMQVGNLYESAHEYINAEQAYNQAVQKAPDDNYSPHYKLAQVLIQQAKFNEAEKFIQSIKDFQDVKLIKFKTRAYIDMGDKYYSIGKFIKAAHSYEKAKYYYDKFYKQDKIIKESINIRIYKSYEQAADTLVKSGLNSDAIKLLKKALVYNPEDLDLKYKMAIVYTDLDPEAAVKMFEKLYEKIPQHIDYNIYNKALMKSANIADLDGRKTVAKYYRYKIHSKDLFLNKKVIYKDDISPILKDFGVKKVLFNYVFKVTMAFENISTVDINNLSAEFVLKNEDKKRDSVIVPCISKKKTLYSNGGITKDIKVQLGKNIFTKRELKQYTMEVYLYKDEKFKTLVGTYKLP